MSKIVIIIPTFNEKESISPLIDSLEIEFKSIPKHEMEILIVDGNSPDGTVDAIREEMHKYSNLKLVVEEKKQGLGMAYITGMKYAVDKLNADAFIEFDGDFQHDPKDIKRLVAEYDNGYDYVIGSRYIAGGSIPREWAWYRKLLSRFGSLFTQFMLMLPVKDNTSGFKLTRVEGFASHLPLDKDKILSRRHAYKIHLLYEMFRLGAKIKEVPIKFLERQGGDSKSSSEDIFESLRVVFRLYFR